MVEPRPPGPLPVRDHRRIAAVVVVQEAQPRAIEALPLRSAVPAVAAVELDERLVVLRLHRVVRPAGKQNRQWSQRQLLEEPRLPIVQRPAAPGEERAGRVVEAEGRAR